MDVPTRDYDRCFEGAELQRIHRLRSLDRNRPRFSWLFGISVFGFVLVVSSAWTAAFSVIGFWLGLLAGACGGYWLYHHLNTRIEREFVEKWDPLFLERSALSLHQIAAREEIIRLTDSPQFYGLTQEEQRATVRRINQKCGLEQ